MSLVLLYSICATYFTLSMGALAGQHIYLRLPYLQYFARRAQGTLDREMTKELLRLSEQLSMYRH